MTRFHFSFRLLMALLVSAVVIVALALYLSRASEREEYERAWAAARKTADSIVQIARADSARKADSIKEYRRKVNIIADEYRALPTQKQRDSFAFERTNRLSKNIFEGRDFQADLKRALDSVHRFEIGKENK